MAAALLQTVIIPDDDDDDDLSLIYVTPSKTGATKIDAIPVDNYRRRSRTVITIDDSPFGDGDLQLLPRKFYRGECSTSSEKKPQRRRNRIPPIFTCEICADEKPRIDAFRVLGCDHCYCTDCIAKYVAVKLQDNITDINCPVSNCKGYFESQDCRFILPQQVFDRWGDALCEAVILGSEKFYCPYKDCSAPIIREDCVKIEQSECPYCNRLFCVQCNVPWHPEISCAEFQKLNKDERSNEDILLMNLAKKSAWMRCPKCKIYVSKIEGCLFIRCRCGHSFCYNCGSQMTVDHYCQKCKH